MPKYTPFNKYPMVTETDALNVTHITRTDFAFHAVNHRHNHIEGSDTELKLSRLEEEWKRVQSIAQAALEFPRARIFGVDVTVEKKMEGAENDGSSNMSLIPKGLQSSIYMMYRDNNDVGSNNERKGFVFLAPKGRGKKTTYRFIQLVLKSLKKAQDPDA